MKEKQRIEVVQAVMCGSVSVEQAGQILNRSVRQVFRLLSRLKDRGLEGLVHGNKGKSSSRRISEKVSHKIITLARGKLSDINDTHLAQILLREEKIKISRSALRRLLRTAGIKAKLKRRSRKHRSRRERKAAFGMMLQIDASPHDWLEGRAPRLALIGAKDDATGRVWARFEETETTWGYLELMREIFLSEGVPFSLYSDRHTIFHSPKELSIIDQLQNMRPLTQFGRAMDELGVSLIKAWSAPAKGRIENQWKTFQDRLVVELRLAGIDNKEAANDMLKPFLKDYNRQFCVSPRQREAVFLPSPTPAVLERILCLKETRTVAKDHTISFEGLVLQIPPSRKYHSIARQQVEVLQLRDGSIEITHKNHTLARFRPEAVSRLMNKNLYDKSQLKQAA